jgi:type II restriction/modification system DNA methylase subunit YeeA
MSTEVVPDHKLHVFPRADDYFFGMLHSQAHEEWTLGNCSWIGKGNDPSYNSDAVFKTFPFPWRPGSEPTEKADPRIHAIAEAARALVRLRDAWLNPPGASEVDLKKRTLTNLYNERPEWLANAHLALDRPVLAAYGWAYPLTRSEILQRLLALNIERGTGSVNVPHSDLPPKKAPGVERPSTQKAVVNRRR